MDTEKSSNENNENQSIQTIETNKHAERSERRKEDRILFKRIFNITWPAFLELFLSSTFNVVDMIMVGRLSPASLSGVGLTTQPFFLLISIFSAVNVGTTTMVSWSIGQNDYKRASFILKQALFANLIMGTLLTAVGLLISSPVMKFMSPDAETLGHALTYLRIIICGLVFQAVTMCVSAALRGSGETRIPMIYNLASNFVNVGLNYVLIYGKLGQPQMGVAGAALATTISRFTACVAAVSVIIFWKKSPIRLKVREKFTFEFQTVYGILAIGIPAAGEQFVIQSGLMVFAKFISNLGTVPYAAHQVVGTVNSMAFSVSQAFSVSNTALVGQSVGAGNYDHAEKITKMNRKLARLSSVVIAIGFIVFARQIAGLYTDVKEVIDIAAPLFIFIAAIQFVQSSQMSVSGALRGSGDTMYPLYATIAGIWIFRVFFGWVFISALGFGVTGAWIAFFLDQTIRNLIVMFRFRTGKWRHMKAIREEKSRKRQEKVDRLMSKSQ